MAAAALSPPDTAPPLACADVTAQAGVTFVHAGSPTAEKYLLGWRDLVVAQGHVLDTVEVTTPHSRYRQPANATGRYLSASDVPTHFGLGAATTVASVRVRWPSGIDHRVRPEGVDRVIRITEPQATDPAARR